MVQKEEAGCHCRGAIGRVLVSATASYLTSARGTLSSDLKPSRGPASAPELAGCRSFWVVQTPGLGGAQCGAASQEGGASPGVLLVPTAPEPPEPGGEDAAWRGSERDGCLRLPPQRDFLLPPAPAQEAARFLRARAKPASPGCWEVCFFADCSQIELREEGETPPWGSSWDGSGLRLLPHLEHSPTGCPQSKRSRL